MDALIRTLKVFVVVGGILLIGGTILLVVLLVNRKGDDGALLSSGPVKIPNTVMLPPDSTVRQMEANDQGVFLLIEGIDGRMSIAHLDPTLANGVRLIPINVRDNP